MADLSVAMMAVERAGPSAGVMAGHLAATSVDEKAEQLAGSKVAE